MSGYQEGEHNVFCLEYTLQKKCQLTKCIFNECAQTMSPALF